MTAISKIFHHGTSLTKASKALIFLHGRGGNAESLLTLVDKLCGHDFYIALPQAARSSWYPFSFMEEEKRNEPYLSLSIGEIKHLLEQTATSIPKYHIYLAGFSQGACLALEVAAQFAERYGGIIAFTGGLIGSAVDASKYQGDFKETKVFISNGDQDPHIPLIRSIQSKELMEKMGARVTLKIYEGRPHLITEDEIERVKTEILEVF